MSPDGNIRFPYRSCSRANSRSIRIGVGVYTNTIRLTFSVNVSPQPSNDPDNTQPSSPSASSIRRTRSAGDAWSRTADWSGTNRSHHNPHGGLPTLRQGHCLALSPLNTMLQLCRSRAPPVSSSTFSREQLGSQILNHFRSSPIQEQTRLSKHFG